MNNAEIQIQFPTPGQWNKFTMTVVYQDADGYTHTDSYTQDDIPADQAPAMETVVAALVGLGEDWQATQVWAVLTKALHFPDDSEESVVKDGLLLTVEASNDEGGRKIFTYSDYTEFLVYDPAAVAFFRYFTAADSVNS